MGTARPHPCPQSSAREEQTIPTREPQGTGARGPPEPWEGIQNLEAGDTHDGFEDKNGGGRKGEYFWKAARRAGEQGGGR